MNPESDIFQALQDPAGALDAGTLIDDRFEIHERVGAGGMGFIYKASDKVNDNVVALKVLRSPLVTDRSAVKRFAREAWTISQIEHDNVVHVISCRRSREGFLYIAMEWLDGLNLAEVVDQYGPLDPGFAAWLGLHVARALAAAHEKGIVHRDLKPENVFLLQRSSTDRTIKVLDFGIAKLTDPKYAVSKLTQSGTVCGTPEFMSPEQARGDDLDGRSDLYALGCVLFTLLTGVPPFGGDTPLQVLFAQLGSPIPALPATVPALLSDVVKRAMAKEPDGRFPDAMAMAHALERAFLTAGGAAAHGQSVDYVAQRTVIEPLQALGLAPTLMDVPSVTEPPPSLEAELVRDTGTMPQVGEDPRPTMLFEEQQPSGMPFQTPGQTPMPPPGMMAGLSPLRRHPVYDSQHGRLLIVLALVLALSLVALAVLFALSL